MCSIDPSPSAVEYWGKAERDRFTSPDGYVALDAGDIPDARKELQLEMQAIKLMMSSVRTRYNALALVNRLPSEVLARMFCHFCDISMLDYAARNTRAVVLSHVCHHWRVVAIGHPGLWSHILIGSGSTEEYLRRSSGAPIIINHAMRQLTEPSNQFRQPNGHRAEDVHVEDLARIISQNPSRLLGFGLSATLADFKTVLPVLLHSPLPVLEKVILTHSTWAQGLSPAVPLPLDLFSASAPRLRHLRLDGWTIPWPSLAFSTLVHLHLVGERLSPINTGDFGEFLSALSRTPLLEVVQLIHALPPSRLGVPWRSADGEAEQRLSLPHLRELVLVDTLRKCRLALEYTVAPPSSTCRIYCMDGREKCSLLVPWFSAKVNAYTSRYQASLPIGMLEVMQRADDIEITAFPLRTSDADPPSREHAPAPLLELRLEGQTDGRHALDEMRGLLNVLPLEHIRVLHVFYDADVVAFSDWTRVFCACAGLRHVSVVCGEPDCNSDGDGDSDGGEPSVVERLLAVGVSSQTTTTTTTTTTTPTDESPPNPFPAFISLALRGIDFGQNVNVHDRLLAWLGRWGSFEKLVLKESTVCTALSDRLRVLAVELDL
ncbi:hypothetical protein DENSPDRAFT_454654 [Dentipellis sp. KUC8613]|nr:hypothetical protein DENSPDRAFT_454654 [Dentipellis sp. KUC8613]